MQLVAVAFCVSLACVLTGCHGDGKESFYPSLADAKMDEAVARGWIPEYLPASSRAIHELGDLSPTREWCAFDFLPADSAGLRKSLKKVDVLPSSMMRVPSPGRSWWPFLLQGNLNVDKIHDAGFELYMAEEPETPSTTAVFLFAIDWAKGRGFLYRRSR